MNESVKKKLNIASYVLNGVLALVIVLMCVDCGGNRKKVEMIKSKVVEQERSAMPLTLQKLPGVFNISIDSIVMVSTVEPYSAYLVTTWDIAHSADAKVNVPVENIQVKGKDVTWEVNWLGAGLQSAAGKMVEGFTEDTIAI